MLKEIFERGGKLYEKFVDSLEEFEKIGDKIKGAMSLMKMHIIS